MARRLFTIAIFVVAFTSADFLSAQQDSKSNGELFKSSSNIQDPSNIGFEEIPAVLTKPAVNTFKAPQRRKNGVFQPLAPAPMSYQRPTDRKSVSAKSVASPLAPKFKAMSAPAIQTQIIAPKYINVNQTAEIQINVQNVGQVDVDQVKLTAILPTHAKFISSQPKATSIDGQRYEFVLPGIHQRQNEVIQLNIVPTDKLPLDIATSVQVLSQQSVAVSVRQPVLDIELSGPSQSQTGHWVKHKFIIRNTGDGVAENIKLMADFTDQLSVAPDQPLILLERLMPGETSNLEFKTRAELPGDAKLKFTVTSVGLEPREMNSVVTILQPELRVTIDGPQMNYVSRPGIYTVRVENSGQVEISNVGVTLAIPSGLRVDTISRQAKIDNKAGTLHWTFASVPAGAGHTIQLQAVGIQAGNQVCHLDVSSDETANKRFDVSTEIVTRADVNVRIADTGGPIRVGNNSSFVVEIENLGSSVAKDVQVVVDLPAGLKPVESDEYSVNELGSQISFESLEIESGKKRQMQFAVTGVHQGEHIVRGTVHFNGSNRQIVAEDMVYVFETETSRVSEALIPDKIKR